MHALGSDAGQAGVLADFYVCLRPLDLPMQHKIVCACPGGEDEASCRYCSKVLCFPRSSFFLISLIRNLCMHLSSVLFVRANLSKILERIFSSSSSSFDQKKRKCSGLGRWNSSHGALLSCFSTSYAEQGSSPCSSLEKSVLNATR